MFANTTIERSLSDNHTNKQYFCTSLCKVSGSINDGISMLEKVFSPSFFDVMSHVSTHLVQQLIVCGQSTHDGCTRWNNTSNH